MERLLRPLLPAWHHSACGQGMACGPGAGERPAPQQASLGLSVTGCEAADSDPNLSGAWGGAGRITRTPEGRRQDACMDGQCSVGGSKGDEGQALDLL